MIPMTNQLTNYDNNENFSLLPQHYDSYVDSPDSDDDPSLVVSKTPNSSTINVGSPVTFTITITNTEGITANNVVLKEQIPSSASFVPNSLTINGSSVTCNELPSGIGLDTVPVGTTEIITYQLIFNSIPATNPVANKPVVTYSYLTSSGANQSSSLTGTVVPLTVQDSTTSPSPSLSVSKAPNSSTVNVGSAITFTINITNNGGITANNVVLKEQVPSNASFVPNSLIINGSSVTCNNLPSGIGLDTVPVGTTETITYQLIFNSIPATNPVANKPVVTYNYLTSNGANQSSSVTGTVVPLTIQPSVGSSGQLTVYKIPNPSSITVGKIVTFTITITNNTSNTVNNVVLKDQLPTNAHFVSKSLTVNSIPVSDCSLPSEISLGYIAASNTTNVTYQIIFNSMPQQNPVQIAPIVTYSYVDSSCSNQSSSVTGTVTALTVQPSLDSSEPLLTVSKTPNSAIALIGEVITYRVTVTNDQKTPATNVVLNEPFPNNACFVPNSLTINNSTICGCSFPTSGINLGNVNADSSCVITYELIFTSIPATNPVAHTPIVSYSYVGANGSNESTSVTGSVYPITVQAPIQSPNPPCSCCCCCPCTPPSCSVSNPCCMQNPCSMQSYYSSMSNYCDMIY